MNPSAFPNSCELIPVFYQGERVLVTPCPNPEYACPCCGHVIGSPIDGPGAHPDIPAWDEGDSYPAVVRGVAKRVSCALCGFVRRVDGHYSVVVGQHHFGIPYPWLARLDEVQS